MSGAVFGVFCCFSWFRPGGFPVWGGGGGGRGGGGGEVITYIDFHVGLRSRVLSLEFRL